MIYGTRLKIYRLQSKLRASKKFVQMMRGYAMMQSWQKSSRGRLIKK